MRGEGKPIQKGAGYVLRPSADRRRVLLEHEHTKGWFGSPDVSEPVPKFDYPITRSLVVFGCFEPGAITHITDGKRSRVKAGTGLSRLDLSNIAPLKSPIRFAQLLRRIPKKLRSHVRRSLTFGGRLPPASFHAVVDALLKLDESLAPRLAKYSEERRALIGALGPAARDNLAYQKETLIAALRIAGIEVDTVSEWTPSDAEKPATSFLEGLQGAYVREDVMLLSDFGKIPGFSAVRDTNYAAKVFKSDDNPSLALTVIMANRLALEEQTGADLIYVNEKYRAFVFVQYKAMDHTADTAVFRWAEGDQLAKEIERMDALLEEIAKFPKDQSPTGFRLHQNPFLLKICPRTGFDPNDTGLFPGMYLPLDYWKTLAKDPSTLGPKGGRYVSYDNVPRRLSNTDFIALVANAWLGTSLANPELLENLIRAVLESGKTVTLAFKHDVKDEPASSSHTLPGGFSPEGEAVRADEVTSEVDLDELILH